MPYRSEHTWNLQLALLYIKQLQGLGRSKTSLSINIPRNRRLILGDRDSIEWILCRMLSRSWKQTLRNWTTITRFSSEIHRLMVLNSASNIKLPIDIL